MSATTVEAIDLKPGMIYRLFTSHDWATIKHVSYTFRRGTIHGVDIRNVEGRTRGCWLGAHERVTVKEVNK